MGSLIHQQLQLYEHIVFDATHNGFQKRKTKSSLNSVLHSVWKLRIQGKGFSLANQNGGGMGGLVSAFFLYLVTGAHSPERKDLTRTLQSLPLRKEVLEPARENVMCL